MSGECVDEVSAADAGVSEQALLLGSRKSIVGVLAQPAGGADPSLPLILLLNAGIIHRVGPNRINVTLARVLARAGYVSLRFDLSGLGDSEPREEPLSPGEAAMADIREVIDTLEHTRGARQLVLVGLCSGADYGVFYSGRDPRVTGAVLIDPTVPRTSRYYVNHYARRMLRAQSWANVLRGRHAVFHALRRRAQEESSLDAPRSNDAAIDSPQTRALLEQAYQAAVDNHVRMLAAFTPDRETRLNYREQLLDALPNVRFGDALRLEWFADADHTFTYERPRAALVSRILQWVREGWPHPAQPPSITSPGTLATQRSGVNTSTP